MSARILPALASLRLTVWLFAWAMILIFVGTLAQVEQGVWQAVATYFRSIIAWLDPFLLIPGVSGPEWLRVPIPGGSTIAALMVINLLAAHAVKFRFSAQRFGIILLHAGVIVLLLGEFVTGLFSREGLMRIDVGGRSAFVEDLRTVELAIIDPSAAETDRIYSFPQRLLEHSAESRRRLEHPSLPFTIQIEKWHPNARLLRARGDAAADRGVGIEAVAEPIPPVRGVDGGASDAPAAYVSLYRDAERLGTWLVSADLTDAQAVTLDSAQFGIALRYKRRYLPYTLELKEFRHDKFTGTQIARNFSSRVRILDPSHGTDREVVIWMNNPLRYRGATFYQASYKPDGSGTVLQVVENPGAVLPYIASTMVGLGMTWHFLWMLVGYLRRMTKVPAASAELPVVAPNLGRRFQGVAYPVAFGLIGLVLACHPALRPLPQEAYNLRGFSLIPVSSGGRIKPMDTAARHLVQVAGGRQSIRTPEESIPAIRYLLDLVAKPEAIRDTPVVRVDHPGVLALLEMKPEDAGRLSLATIEKHWELVSHQAHIAASVEARERDDFQRAVLMLYSRVSELLDHSALTQPYSVPPLGPDGEWAPFSEIFASNLKSGETHPSIAYQVALFSAWNEGDAPRFNRAVEGYLSLLDRDMPSVMQRARLEVWFNQWAPFRGAMVLYILVFLLTCGGLLIRLRSEVTGGDRWGERVRRGALALLWSALIVHTLALLIRIYLQGRPPVTNLYSSAIFVGWAAVLLGVVMEHLHRLGVAALGASGVGFATLVVAHNLGTDGDTMQMMQAVLDSNFWLATHVITITLGYSATFLAGALAATWLIMAALSHALTDERSRALQRMVYGSVCFALLLSFVGTVLGGIWADQSWGRFWGWDPKENGAALVVLICAIILHARWGGMIRVRGMMVLAVFGNIVTAWSWFGTNMLGVGLHSYGFMSSGLFWMIVFVSSQLGIMLLGLRLNGGAASRQPKPTTTEVIA